MSRRRHRYQNRKDPKVLIVSFIRTPQAKVSALEPSQSQRLTNCGSRRTSGRCAPALAVPEDPVCGSGNASVAAYLIHTGLISEIGTDYTARQCMNIGRDGLVAVKVAGDEISIGGYAVTCVDGTLRVA